MLDVELFPTFQTDFNAAIENILFDYRRPSLNYYWFSELV